MHVGERCIIVIRIAVPQIFFRIVHPIVAGHSATVSCGNVTSPVYDKGYGLTAGNGVIVVIVFVVVGISYVAQACPRGAIEFVEIVYIRIVVCPKTDISHIINDESHTVNTLGALEPIHNLPLAARSGIGVETVEVFQVIIVIPRADIAISTYAEAQCPVTHASGEIIFLSPLVCGRIVFPGICQIIRLILKGSRGDITFAIKGKSCSAMAALRFIGHVGTLSPIVSFYVISPTVFQQVTVGASITAAQISFIVNGEAAGIATRHTVEIRTPYPLSLCVFVIIRASGKQAGKNYQLSTPIELEDDADLYNCTVWPTEDTPLSSFTYRPRPGEKRVHEIRLPDEWGQQLLDDLVNEEEYLESQEDFKRHFPGLAFVPDESVQCISGFQVGDSSMCLVLHYQEISEQREEKQLTFSVNMDYAYTGIKHDCSNTILSDVPSGIENYVHSTDLGHRAYMQGLTGYYNQLEFPYLNDLQDAGQIVSIESATLYLYPLEGSYNKTNQLPSDIRLYITDENNVLEDYVYGSDGVTVQTGNLTVDDVFGRDTYYSFDLTEFIRNNFDTWGMNRQKLLMNMPSDDAASTFNQVIFSNDPAEERQCRLDVRFKTYDEQ